MNDLIERALAEDVGSGDLTSAAVVPEGALARARIEQKAEGCIAGLRVAPAVFERVEPALSFRALVEEGEWRTGGPVAEVEGPARGILGAERVALNFLARLSGVATLTARFVRAVEGTGVRILDTRKTTPGMRALEKEAVLAGGGESHRGGLHDALLVKENHVTLAGGVEEAARRALADAPDGAVVQLECRSLEEVEQALAAGVGLVLLDNMTTAELAEAVRLCDGRAETEASGGITLHTVRAIAETGVDRISVGALTNSAPALDLSLLLEPLPQAPGGAA